MGGRGRVLYLYLHSTLDCNFKKNWDCSFLLFKRSYFLVILPGGKRTESFLPFLYQLPCMLKLLYIILLLEVHKYITLLHHICVKRKVLKMEAQESFLVAGESNAFYLRIVSNRTKLW